MAAMSPRDAPALAKAGGDIPAHVAIIMDGNGRWAQARGLPRAAGHERGVEALRKTVEAAGELGIQHLTVFSFSTENWHRPAAEVSALFGLLKAYIRRDLKRLTREGVRVRILGHRAGVPEDVVDLLVQAEQDTAQNTSFHLNIAFNYGGREEITRAVARIADDVKAGDLVPSMINEELIARYLDTGGLPDPDLLIRTSGEYRLSNFLLWQLAYTEMIFMDVLWPDFGRTELETALAEYARRERRFGGVITDVANG